MARTKKTAAVESEAAAVETVANTAESVANPEKADKKAAKTTEKAKKASTSAGGYEAGKTYNALEVMALRDGIGGTPCATLYKFGAIIPDEVIEQGGGVWLRVGDAYACAKDEEHIYIK